MTPVTPWLAAKEILFLSPLFRSSADHREKADASAWIVARRRTGYRDTVTGGKAFLFFSRFLGRERERGKEERTRVGGVGGSTRLCAAASLFVFLWFLCEFLCVCEWTRARIRAREPLMCERVNELLLWRKIVRDKVVGIWELQESAYVPLLRYRSWGSFVVKFLLNFRKL